MNVQSVHRHNTQNPQKAVTPGCCNLQTLLKQKSCWCMFEVRRRKKRTFRTEEKNVRRHMAISSPAPQRTEGETTVILWANELWPSWKRGPHKSVVPLSAESIFFYARPFWIWREVNCLVGELLVLNGILRMEQCEWSETKDIGKPSYCHVRWLNEMVFR